MTVEELKKAYEKESGKLFKTKDTFQDNFVYLNWKTTSDYIGWLEQKLTQPCPECEQQKTRIMQLEKEVRRIKNDREMLTNEILEYEDRNPHSIKLR